MDFKNKAELIEMATKEKKQNEFQCISVGISKKTKKNNKTNSLSFEHSSFEI